MAWIKVIDEAEATGAVKRVYEGKKVAVIRKAAVGEIVKVFSLRPDLLEAPTEFGTTMTFGGSGLGRFREELIAVSISAMLQCLF